MLALPIRLVKFWFFDSLALFFRTWQHTISIIEEDLAVGLMLKLLFIPLFHDSSGVGKILSFMFRSFRIFLGLIAYLIATLILLGVAIGWYILPVLLFTINYYWVPQILFLIGIALFIDQVIFYPEKKVWQIKKAKDIWKATKVSKKEISWNNLLKSHEVEQLLFTLELKPEQFAPQNLKIEPKHEEIIFRLARTNKAKFIGKEYFFVALLSQIPDIENHLLKLNIKLEDLYEALNYQELKKLKWRKVFLWDEEFGNKHLKGVNRGWLSAPTPALDSMTTDLTREAGRVGFDSFLGRNTTVLQVINILSAPRDRNVVLIGEPGAGRSALVKHLAGLIISGDAPEALATKRLLQLDLSKLLAGVKTEGDLAENIEEAFSEARSIQNAIIYIDEIHNFALGDVGNQFNLFSLLLPHLESNELQFIASTEPQAYTKIIEKQSWFARVFNKVEVPPATPKETFEILEEVAIKSAHEEKLQFTYFALKEIVEYAAKLIHDRVLPDSALSIMNESKRMNHGGIIDQSVVKKVIGRRVNVPVVDIDEGQKEKLLNLEEQIHQRFIDQLEAVSSVANTLRRAATSLRDEKRPIGSFLFVGPTGVGKTELAKVLTEVYFKDAAAFYRFDMSEYQTSEAVSRLIGSAEELGQLTEAIRNKPYALILLDEFEKADPKILNLFLQVLEDGRLTDGTGRTIDFTNTIIIATSNAPSSSRDELLKTFKPELLNRFDSIIVFKPLSAENLEKIVRLKLNQLQDQLKEKGYLIDFDPNLISVLAQKGFDPNYGARPLRRLIQDSLEANLSKMILEGKLNKGEKFSVTNIF